MVVMCFPPAIMTGITQGRTGAPSICIVQAPHAPMPQPNLLPVRPRCSRTTHSSGTSSGPPNSAGLPLTRNFTDIVSNLSVRASPLRPGTRPPEAASHRAAARGGGGGQQALARPLRRTIAGEHDRHDLRHFVDANERIVKEVRLIGAAV